jgi:galactoside O-acetyltransferase
MEYEIMQNIISQLNKKNIKKVICFGAGSLARKIYSYLRKHESVEILAFADNNQLLWYGAIDNIPIIPPKDILEYNYESILILGPYQEEIIIQLRDMGIDKQHTFSYSQDNCSASIEATLLNSSNIYNCTKVAIKNKNILLGKFSVELRNPIEDRIYLSIGDNNMLDCSLIFERDKGYIKIGNRNYIGNSTKLISACDIEIGDDVIIAWGTTIYDHNSHSIYWEERKNDIAQYMRDYNKGISYGAKNKDWNNVSQEKITIKDKAWIGFEAVIMKGVTIGEGAVVAARSVVVKDVEPYTVVGGNPARVIKNIHSIID